MFVSFIITSTNEKRLIIHFVGLFGIMKHFELFVTFTTFVDIQPSKVHVVILRLFLWKERYNGGIAGWHESLN